MVSAITKYAEPVNFFVCKLNVILFSFNNLFTFCFNKELPLAWSITLISSGETLCFFRKLQLITFSGYATNIARKELLCSPKVVIRFF